jgi:hypothetical protein
MESRLNFSPDLFSVQLPSVVQFFPAAAVRLSICTGDVTVASPLWSVAHGSGNPMNRTSCRRVFYGLHTSVSPAGDEVDAANLFRSSDLAMNKSRARLYLH